MKNCRQRRMKFKTQKSCVDEDECKDENRCLNGECKNTAGSFRCVCNKGYEYDFVQGICKNINECQYNPCQGGECKARVRKFALQFY